MMTLSQEEMFYLATGLLDVNSWTSSHTINEHSSRTVPKYTAAHDESSKTRAMPPLPSRPANGFQSSSSASSLLPHSTTPRSSTWPSGSSRPSCCLNVCLTVAVILLAFSLPVAEGCSSRSTPKPRPPPPLPSPTPAVRPNITFQTYACPPAYATYYCLNGATCFTIKIGESILYNCECTEGFMGQRCEYKDLEGSYLPLREKIMLERASIAGGATVAVVLVVIISIIFYTYVRQQKKEQRLSLEKVTADKIQFRNHSSCHSFGATPLKTYPLFYHQPIRVDNKTPPTLGLGVVDALRVATVERKHNEPISLLTLALSMNVVAEGCPVPKRDQTVVVLSNDFANKTMIDQPSS